MIRRTPTSTPKDTLCPYTKLFPSKSHYIANGHVYNPAAFLLSDGIKAPPVMRNRQHPALVRGSSQPDPHPRLIPQGRSIHGLPCRSFDRPRRDHLVVWRLWVSHLRQCFGPDQYTTRSRESRCNV